MDNPLKKTLTEQIYQILRDDILDLRIPQGEKLTLQTLKERFGVSHTPIREALTRLTEDGLVTHCTNVGVNVISLTEKDVRDIFQLSYDFDCLAIKYAMVSGSRERLLSLLRENVESCNRLLLEDKIDQWKVRSDGFHLAFHACSNNARLEEAAYKLRAQMTFIYNRCRIDTVSCKRIQEYHNAIFDCLKKGDMEGAFDKLRLHIFTDMDDAVSMMVDGKLV
ncbi:MAG: GntR family transcriptional regulator [Christensenellales bacterium]|jgi:DNA-binding GntR family transcriptional regulator